MSIKLEDYEEFLQEVPAIRNVLDGTFQEASRLMSTSGLEEYMDGAKAMHISDAAVIWLFLIFRKCRWWSKSAAKILFPIASPPP